MHSDASAADMAVVTEVPRPVLPPLRLRITREMWSEFFIITRLDNNYTEELEPDETRAWLKAHGADMAKSEKVLDHVWNFGLVETTIHRPIEPPIQKRDAEPDI